MEYSRLQMAHSQSPWHREQWPLQNLKSITFDAHLLKKNRGYIKKQLMTSAVCRYKDTYIRMQHACGLDSDSVNISFLDYKSFHQLNQRSLIV